MKRKLSDLEINNVENSNSSDHPVQTFSDVLSDLKSFAYCKFWPDLAQASNFHQATPKNRGCLNAARLGNDRFFRYSSVSKHQRKILKCTSVLLVCLVLFLRNSHIF